uniref:Uncharacterized protein n=1 Tax=Romanomermis culicivorax TaxID=13658 RepID=A0A915I6X4_ROMCU
MKLTKTNQVYCSRQILKISSHPIMAVTFEKSFFNKISGFFPVFSVQQKIPGLFPVSPIAMNPDKQT